jgi:excisionase family DNA binding protein
MATPRISKHYKDGAKIESVLAVSNVEFITVEEAAKLLNFKKSYIYSLIHQKRIPYYKPFGKRVYFNKQELLQWIAKSKIKSVDEVEEEYNKQKEFGE